MADPSSEKSEEIENIGAKLNALDKLTTLSSGRLLKAGTQAQAQGVLYELLFFRLAIFQLDTSRSRLLGREGGLKEQGGWVSESYQLLEEIRRGDWTFAKREIEESICGDFEGDPDTPERMQLDGNFSYKGRAIFSRVNLKPSAPLDPLLF